MDDFNDKPIDVAARLRESVEAHRECRTDPTTRRLLAAVRRLRDSASKQNDAILNGMVQGMVRQAEQILAREIAPTLFVRPDRMPH
jgi:hypothetical protein